MPRFYRPGTSNEDQLIISAILNNITRFQKLFLKQPDVNYTIRQSTALHEAALRGHEQIVRMLLTDKRINVHVRDRHNHTALFLALNAGHVHVARALVNHGAKLDEDCMKTTLIMSNSLDVSKLMRTTYKNFA